MATVSTMEHNTHREQSGTMDVTMSVCVLMQDMENMNVPTSEYYQFVISYSFTNVCGPYGAAVECWTWNREVSGVNLDRCTVILSPPADTG